MTTEAPLAPAWDRVWLTRAASLVLSAAPTGTLSSVHHARKVFIQQGTGSVCTRAAYGRNQLAAKLISVLWGRDLGVWTDANFLGVASACRSPESLPWGPGSCSCKWLGA